MFDIGCDCVTFSLETGCPSCADSTGETGILDHEGDALAVHGNRPDYDSGPCLSLVTAMVRLARQDMSNPLYSAECRSFLTGNLVALFADCLGYEGSFLGGRT